MRGIDTKGLPANIVKEILSDSILPIKSAITFLADSILFGEISSASIDFDISSTIAISIHFLFSSFLILLNQGLARSKTKHTNIPILITISVYHHRELVQYTLFSNSIGQKLIHFLFFLSSKKAIIGINSNNSKQIGYWNSIFKIFIFFVYLTSLLYFF